MRKFGILMVSALLVGSLVVKVIPGALYWTMEMLIWIFRRLRLRKNVKKAMILPIPTIQTV
ncbi:hypothetical protein JCM15765_38120 [Paradesulfitobacterium aromaticivorans]